MSSCRSNIFLQNLVGDTICIDTPTMTLQNLFTLARDEWGPSNPKIDATIWLAIDKDTETDLSRIPYNRTLASVVEDEIRLKTGKAGKTGKTGKVGKAGKGENIIRLFYVIEGTEVDYDGMDRREFLQTLFNESDGMSLSEYVRMIRNLPKWMGRYVWMFINEYPAYRAVFTTDCSDETTVTPLSVISHNPANRDKALELARTIRENYPEGQEQLTWIVRHSARMAACRSDWDSLVNLVDWFPELKMSTDIQQVLQHDSETIQEERVWTAINELIRRRNATRQGGPRIETVDTEVRDLREDNQPKSWLGTIVLLVAGLLLLILLTYWFVAYATHIGWNVMTFVILGAIIALLMSYYLLVKIAIHRRASWFLPVVMISVVMITGAAIAGWKDVVGIFK